MMIRLWHLSIPKDLKDEEYVNNHFVVMCTKKGVVKKTSLESYSRPRQMELMPLQLGMRISY